jgi:rusticyanin
MVLVAVALIAAAGLGVGIGRAVTSGSTSSSTAASSYAYYQHVMGGYNSMIEGSMMGGRSKYGWMMGSSGYGWMMGGASPPGWMTGGALPGFMMGSSTDPGEVMGSLFADAPGPRVTSAHAAVLAHQIPAGATVDKSSNRITFTGGSVAYKVVASPAGADDRFETAGLVNPTITVPAGTRVSVEFVNANTTSAHGLVISAAGASGSWMPMMSAHPAFAGTATWFLGDATNAGAHSTAIAFTASAAGTYRYLCPVPGHAQRGMAGTFIVS